MLIQCYSPGKCHNYIPGLSRFSRRFTNPQNIFVIVYHRSDRKGEKGWGHLHQATSTSKLYSGTVKIRRLEGRLGPMHYSWYISVIFFSCNWNDGNSQICKSRSISLPSCRFLIDPFQGNHISKQKKNTITGDLFRLHIKKSIFGMPQELLLFSALNSDKSHCHDKVYCVAIIPQSQLLPSMQTRLIILSCLCNFAGGL